MKNDMHLQDAQWKLLEPFLSGKKNHCGANAKNNRLFMEAVLWIVLENGAWRHLPLEFGNWNANYMRFRRWTESNFWNQLAKNHLIHDTDLRMKLERIVTYSQQYKKHLNDKYERRESRKNYKSVMHGGQGNIMQFHDLDDLVVKLLRLRSLIQTLDGSTPHGIGNAPILYIDPDKLCSESKDLLAICNVVIKEIERGGRKKL